MDYGLAFIIGMACVGGLIGGALITMGLIEVVSGRVVMNWRRMDWTSREAAEIGVTRLIQGVAVALYPLIGGLTLGAHVIPEFWVGHWWGIFVSAPFSVVILGTLVFQAALEMRHHRGRPSTSQPR
jgi:hypothetical protein